MTIFTPFKKATGAKTPDFSGAAFAQGRLDEAQTRREEARDSSMLSGGIGLYNEGMGDKTPIADYVGNLMNPGAVSAAATSGELATAMEALNAGVLAPEAMGIMGGALPSTAGSIAAGEAGAAAAGLGGAGGAGAMAGLGPAGIGLALASLLGLFG